MAEHETPGPPSAPRWHVVYLDNNAWVGLSVEKDGVVRHRLTEVLTADEDRCIGFGQQNLAEFSDWTNAHEVFAELVSIWPTAILKTSEAITAMEAAAYPGAREHPILAAASPWGPMENVQAHPIFKGLRSPELIAARRQQQEDAKTIGDRIEAARGGFPPNKNGKYPRSWAGDFAAKMVFQRISRYHGDLFAREGVEPAQLDPGPFRSIRLYALVIYWRYYNQMRTPKPSDLGDLAHLWPLPYVGTAILEKDLAATLKQIQKAYPDVLPSTEVRTIDTLRR